MVKAEFVSLMSVLLVFIAKQVYILFLKGVFPRRLMCLLLTGGCILFNQYGYS